MDEFSDAIQSVEREEAARICKPGVWRVWRDDAGVHWEVMGG